MSMPTRRSEIDLQCDEDLSDFDLTEDEDMIDGAGTCSSGEENSMPEVEVSARKSSNKKGRKGQWTEEAIDDLIDVIVSDENFKRKLIFINQKNQKNSEIYLKVITELKKRNSTFGFSLQQVRNKFKKCVSICKSASMKIKTASGIARFQDEKSYGNWFKVLYGFIKTRDSCRPDLAVEPMASTSTSTSTNEQSQASEVESLPDDATMANTSLSSVDENSSSIEKQQFVPSRGKKRKTKSEWNGDILTMMQKLVDRDLTTDLLKFMKDDMEKSREHELKLFAMLCNNPSITMSQQPAATPPMPNQPNQMFHGATYENRQHGHPLGQASTSGSYLERPNIFQDMRYNMFPEDDNDGEKTYQTL